MRNVDAATREAITRAAQEAGIDPSVALAIAERESNFDPRARNSKTIRGMYQMRGDHRQKYGIGDSDDPYAQAKGWGAFFKDVKREMAGAAGRDVTDAEAYSGHHFGGVRAGRMMKMDPATPVDSVFTPREMAENPHFARAATVGKLLGSVTSDIGKRQAKFGGGIGSTDTLDFAAFGSAPDDLDLGGNLQKVQTTAALDPGTGQQKQGVSNFTKSSESSAALDFSPFGAPADDHQPNLQGNPAGSSVTQPQGAPDFSQFGTPA